MIIYKITNKVDGKVYIGKTKRTLKTRWSQHCRDANSNIGCFKLQKAIKKYGAENFTIEQIDCAATKDEADAKEVYWIRFYNATEIGYNTSPGGKAGGNRKKVKAVEDNLVFDTIVDAAKHYGRNVSAIAQVVDKPHLTSAGNHWISV